ncbi:hypothetical protein LCGC14_1699750 [marine sediment metagenome]|uniref:Uncharacterized protein n=1 Tax=marine sediment metagenome TaxID=412755 RepID=A0A0F9JYY0_9ZZZZ
MCDKKYKRYVVMGLRGGHLHHIIARRGNTPDDIINRALEIVKGPPFLTEADMSKIRFDRLYIMEVGDEGTYGSSTNLKLREIVAPAPKWSLVPVKGLYG